MDFVHVLILDIFHDIFLIFDKKTNYAGYCIDTFFPYTLNISIKTCFFTFLEEFILPMSEGLHIELLVYILSETN